MVASFMEKSVSKSYVRLPGSGSDQSAGSIFCDLSRGSSLAASISVPQCMGMQRSLNSKLSSTAHNKSSRIEDNTIATNESIKRPRIESTTQNVETTPNESTLEPVTVYTVSVTESNQETSNNAIPKTNTANTEPIREPHNPTQVYNTRTTVHNVIKLQEENNQLKAGNASLHKQLSLFKQLMRNPQRLQSVVQRLNERQNLH